MKQIPEWLFWALILIGIIEIIITKNKRLMDFWYKISFLESTSFSKEFYKQSTLIAGIGSIAGGIVSLIILHL